MPMRDQPSLAGCTSAAVTKAPERGLTFLGYARGGIGTRSGFCGGVSVMPSFGWSPKTVPYGADQTVCLVVDRFQTGCVYRETEVKRTDIETIINDLLTGQFNDPVRIVAFNTLEHWSDDVSDEIAAEIQTRCDIAGDPVPEHIEDFVTSHSGPARQLTLPLA
jgi:hypothetical protein